jgi:hypothetical protein
MRPIGQVIGYFLSPFANGVDIHTTYRRHVFCAAVSDFFSFNGHIPTTLLLIKTTQQ